MNTLDVNLNILRNLYEQYPESFRGLGMDGNKLTYNGEGVDISNFNIDDLLSGNQNFFASLSVLNAEDIFKIIRLHALKMDSTLQNVQAKNNKEKMEILKVEDPLLKNISIISKNSNGYQNEYINIVDSSGRDHLFYNDRDVDLFNIYETLKNNNPGRDITPDELVSEIMRKLPEVKLNNAAYLMGSSAISEDFNNKLKLISEPYENDKNIKILGNEEHDMAIIVDLSDPTKHDVITFGKNEFGDLIFETHKPNVEGYNNKTSNGEASDIQGDASVSNNEELDGEILERLEEEKIVNLISEEKFYELIKSSQELNEEDKKNVDYFYTFIGDLITYEDYLLPELTEMLNRFRYFIYHLQYDDQPMGLTKNEEEAIEKAQELEEKNLENVNQYSQEKVEEKVKKLELIKQNSSSGIVSIVQVMAFIIGVAIILTAATLYLIN